MGGSDRLTLDDYRESQGQGSENPPGALESGGPVQDPSGGGDPRSQETAQRAEQIKDSLEAERIEQEIPAPELVSLKKEYEYLIANNPLGIFSVRKNIVINANPRICKILGFEAGEMAGLNIWDIVSPSDKFSVQAALDRARLNPENRDDTLEMKLISKNGNPVWLEAVWEVFDICSTPGFICKGIDITNRKFTEGALRRVNTDLEQWMSRRAALNSATNERLLREIAARRAVEDRLRESERMYRSLVESARDIIWTVDSSTRYTYVSPSVQDLLGYSAKEIMAMDPLSTLTPDSRERILELYSRELGVNGDLPDHGHTRPSEIIEQYHKDGSTRWLEVSATIMCDEYGKASGILGISRDVTERVLARQELQKALNEKEALLNEIHHRVKNNLQVISSLLKLQSKQTEDPLISAAFQESRNRIAAMALVHEKLYLSKDLARIDLEGYMKRVAKDLHHAHYGPDRSIALVMNLKSAPIGINAAIPCGLIVNELLANAFCHAFEDGEDGEVRLDFGKSSEGGEYCLCVSDNGRGIPPDLDMEEPRTLGLKLVRALCNQLSAELKVTSSNGTRFEIIFSE
jgi:PAS domain S-box-containing protein